MSLCLLTTDLVQIAAPGTYDNSAAGRNSSLTIIRQACLTQSPYFFGCCTSNVCNVGGCPDSDLRADVMGYGPGPDGSAYKNDSSYWPNVACPSGSQWYTCAASYPSFQGCCSNTINPCLTGSCPQEQVYPAAFGSIKSTYDPGPDVIECATGTWYSCVQQQPSVQGCCVSGPCTGMGCPYGAVFPISHVVAGAVATKTSTSSISYITSSSSTSSTTIVTSTTSGTTSAGSAVTSTAVPSPTPAPKTNVGCKIYSL